MEKMNFIKRMLGSTYYSHTASYKGRYHNMIIYMGSSNLKLVSLDTGKWYKNNPKKKENVIYDYTQILARCWSYIMDFTDDKKLVLLFSDENVMKLCATTNVLALDKHRNLLYCKYF